MMFQNSKTTLTVLSLAALFLGAVLSFAIYHIQKESRQAQELLTNAAQTEKREIAVKAIRTVQNTASIDLEAFDKIALTDSTLVLAIENIESTARALKLDVEINSVEKVGGTGSGGDGASGAEPEVLPGTKPQMIRIAMDSSGSWSNSFLFLRTIENLPYRVVFESVSVEKRGTDWESKIIISLYIFIK